MIAKLAPAPLFDTLIEGTRVPSRSRTDCLPLASRSRASSTSIGAMLSATVRLAWRVPVTMIGVGSATGSGAGDNAAAGEPAGAALAWANWKDSRLCRAVWRTGAASAMTPAPVVVILSFVPASSRWSAWPVVIHPSTRRLRMPATAS